MGPFAFRNCARIQRQRLLIVKTDTPSAFDSAASFRQKVSPAFRILRARLMVGQQTLNLLIEVRILGPEPFSLEVPMNTIDSDRRTAKRVPVSMTIGSAATGTTVGFGYARDISERGMAIDAEALTSEKSVPLVGSELEMRFKLPKSPLVIHVRGKVMRVALTDRVPMVALEFLDASYEMKSEIRRFISSNSTP